MDNKSFFKMSYGLYIISTNFEGKDCAVIVNTLLQTGSNPPQMTVTISKNSFTGKLIAQSKKLTATVVTENADINFVANFGFNCSEQYDKFVKINWVVAKNGIKYCADNAAAVYECTVTDQKDLGTHIMYFLNVDEAEVLSSAPVMTYAYYHSVVKGTTPKDSPLYKGDTEDKKGFKCSVCGHIEESDELADNFLCPICGKSKEFFEKL